jgi:hypothetical protein
MRTNIRILGVLLAAVVGGCAGTKSTVVPLQPIAQGRPVDASSYDLAVDGASGGRVLFSRGQSIRNVQGQNTIIMSMQVDNRTSGRVYHMPTDQIYLTNLGGSPAKLTMVDNRPVPPAIDVAPGETQNFDLTFTPLQAFSRKDLDNVQVQWTLLIDGASQPIVRSTPFAAMTVASLTAQYPGWAATGTTGYPHYDIPSSTFDQGNDVSEAWREQQDRTLLWWENQGQANMAKHHPAETKQW